MEREIDLNKITDGKRYGLNDMVRTGCGNCAGCSACCHGMGNSIVLDPLDVYRITGELGVSFEKLLADKLELNVVDGIILPNLKMTGEDEACVFLNPQGRCSIHPHRPGICRIFPLGRLYENGSYSYILQVDECKKENRTKVKVEQWIDTPDLKLNQKYICDWHYFLKKAGQYIKESNDDNAARQINMYILSTFFVTPYDKNIDFYEQFYSRFENIEKKCGLV